MSDQPTGFTESNALLALSGVSRVGDDDHALTTMLDHARAILADSPPGELRDLARAASTLSSLCWRMYKERTD